MKRYPDDCFIFWKMLIGKNNDSHNLDDIVMLAKVRRGEHKKVGKKHIHSRNRNKIQVNLVEQ